MNKNSQEHTRKKERKLRVITQMMKKEQLKKECNKRKKSMIRKMTKRKNI